MKKVSTRYELPDGSKVFGKQINANPKKYFTDDVMSQLEVAAGKEFLYGQEGDVIENRDTNTEESSE